MRTATIKIEVVCTAPDNYFEDKLTEESLHELKLHGPIECEGYGIGTYCHQCRFCSSYKVDDLEYES